MSTPSVVKDRERKPKDALTSTDWGELEEIEE